MPKGTLERKSDTDLRAPRPETKAKLQEDEIRHFTLPGMLQANEVLVLNTRIGTLARLTIINEMPRLLTEQQFTASELSVLIPLLEHYPYYCPYEVLLASFSYGHTSEATVLRCRESLQNANDNAKWDQELRPVRNVLSRARLKVRSVGLEISAILETGYILTIFNFAVKNS